MNRQPMPDRHPRRALRAAIATACATCLVLPLPGALAAAGGKGDGATHAAAATRQAFYLRHDKDRRDAVLQAVRAQGGEVTHRLDAVDAVAVLLPQAAVAALAANPHVRLVEPVPEHRPAAQVVPWNVDQMQARDIWDANRDDVVDAGAPTGAGVKVCIIDTGFYAAHDDFQGITVSGLSQIAGESWSEDGNGHGTHVAGTLNAVHNGIGVVGVMPGGAELYIVKIFNNDGVWEPGQSNLGAAAIACRDAGANVISMSLGGGGSATEEAIFQDLYDNHGIVSVAAAGNDGNGAASYPASYESVISVGAVDEAGVAADFTQYPATAHDPDSPPANVEWDVVELAGGGVSVLSTWPGPPSYANAEVPAYQAVTGGGTTYTGNHIDEAGLGTASGVLVDGGLCTAGSGNAGWSGAVVLCERGSVSFAEKINEAGARGAVAAIIYNNAAGNFTGTCGGGCTSTIPAISLSQADGQALVASELGNGIQVQADDGSGCSGCSGSYNVISGTSMATPGVAAGLGFVWNACGGPAGISNKQLRQLLRDSALDLSGTHPGSGDAYGAGWDVATGWGLIQLADALELGNQRFGSTCPIGVAVTPAVVEVCALDTDSAAFTLSLDDQFLASASLSASGLPAAAGGSFSPNPVVHPVKDSTFTLTGLSGASSGSYPLVLTATDDADPGNSAAGAATLVVYAGVPGGTTLAAPGNGASAVALTPTLGWNGAADAGSYRVDIATDPAFGNLAYSATATGTSHTVSAPLANGTTYFWRVTPANRCGEAAPSPTFAFTTTTLACSAPGAAIPDNTAGGVSDELTLSLAGPLTDLDLDVLVTHSWVGDLVLTLTHVATGTAVTVVDRPGRTNNGPGCNGNDIDATLDDEAGSPVEDACAGTTPTILGSFTPNAALGAFDGEDASGTWRLTVRDAAGQDSGTLDGWCLRPTVAASNTAPVAAADAYAVDEDTVLTVPAPGVLANDGDADADALAAQLDTGVSSGVLSLAADGSFSYTPAAGYCGSDSFSYRASDGSAPSGVATVSLSITCVEDGAAVAVDDALAVAEDSGATVVDVLANDATDPDPEQNPVGVTAVGTAGAGTASLAGGVVSYAPDADFCGSDSFGYTLAGGSTATVSVTVACVNDAPVAIATLPDRLATEGEPVSWATGSAFADVDPGDVLAYAASGLPASLAIDPATGTIGGTLQPGDALAGPYLVQVTASDQAGATATLSFNLGVAAGAPLEGDIFSDGFED